jgi:predicted O-linked N-acetylglucosamine transferase (SPINDLY family)
MTLDEAVRLAEDRLTSGDVAGSMEVWRAILDAAPGHPPSLMGLGVCLCALGSYAEGEPLLVQAAKAMPNSADAQNNAGNALRALGQTDEAVAFLSAAIRLNPGLASAWSNLSALSRERGALTEALDLAAEAVQLDPTFPEGRLNRAVALQGLGRLEEGLAELERALKSAPRHMPSWNALMLMALYSDRRSAADIQALAARFGALFPPAPPAAPPREIRRIGWLGGDFRKHPVGDCLAAFLSDLSSLGPQNFLYAQQPPEDSDAVTARLQEAGVWRPIWGRSDADARRMIQEDGIDLLIDLAGHTARGRAAMLAGRVAPLQASWLGFSGSPGVPAIDWLIADSIVIPPTEDGLFREKVVRLPLYICPPWPEPIVTERAEGPCVFGCFNNPAKISDACLESWARILAAAPESRLILKYGSLKDPASQAVHFDRIRAAGIEPDRVEMRGFRPAGEARADYADIDLALDAWPYSGALTTIDALSAGVPVLTCPSDRYAGRQSAAILAACGLEECIFASRAEWEAGAAALAADPSARTALRRRAAAALQPPPWPGPKFAAAFWGALQTALAAAK